MSHISEIIFLYRNNNRSLKAYFLFVLKYLVSRKFIFLEYSSYKKILTFFFGSIANALIWLTSMNTIRNLKIYVQNKHTQSGWLVGFNVELELCSGLLPSVCDSSLRMVLRHTITILIFHGGEGSPVFVPPHV